MDEVAENHQRWRMYSNAYEMIVKDFADRNESLPDHYPHPDELHFPEGRFVTGWLGNEPIQGSIFRQFWVQVRDVALLQCEKDRRHFRSKDELDHISGEIALLINAFLPKAVQLDQVQLMVRLGRQRILRKPELQMRLTTAWAEVGLPPLFSRHQPSALCERHPSARRRPFAFFGRRVKWDRGRHLL